MSWLFWFGLLLMKYLTLFSLNSIALGLFLLFKSFMISLLMATYSISWYSLLFFLIYIGGLLVLFIYMSSLKFNPTFYFKKMKWSSQLLLKFNILLLWVFSLTQITWNFKSINWSKSEFNNFSLNLFKESEILFLVNVGILLLVVLWVMTKLSFRSRGALRPLF